MDFYFENQGTNTYLVYAVKPEDTIDSLSLGMLTNNKILGLAQTQFMQMDAEKFIKYNVSAHISVKQFFEGTVNRKRLIGVFKGIVNALISAEDYMIDVNSIVIDLNYMFADVSTCETVLICWPIVGVNQGQSDLGAFFKNIMFSTQFDQTDNCDYVAKIINYLNSEATFSLAEFKNVLDSIDGVAEVQSSEAPKMSTVTKPVVKENVETPIDAKPSMQSSVQSVVSNSQPKVKLPSQQSMVSGQKQKPVSKEQVSPMSPRMQVPGQKSSTVAPTTDAVTASDKEISWFYLMQHYNKENAAIYKAQKEAKKTGKAKVVSDTQTPQKGITHTSQSGSGFISKGAETTQKQPITNPVVTPPQSVAMNSQKVESVTAPQPAYVAREVSQGQSVNFGETTVLGGPAIGETTVLNVAHASSQMIAPHLLRKKTNEKISLNKPIYRIGKERSYVDYFIGDNTAISRSHANLVSREGAYFVVDTNSTNHTFVNGTMINSNEEIPINHGDIIRLANEDFEFKIY